MDLFVHFSLIPAVLITIFLCFLQRRAQRHRIDDKLPLNQRFGIIEPVNFGSLSNRWSLGAACGAAATTLFLLFIKGYSDYFPFKIPVWAEVFVYLLSSLEAAIDYYPFFACLSTRNKLIGSVLGFCYALTWFSVQFIYIFSCQINENTHFSKLIPVPSLICCLFLMGRFVQIFAKQVKGYYRKEVDDEEEPFLHSHQYNYVKNLFKVKSNDENAGKSCFARRIYSWDPHFKYPLRMVVTGILCLICLYNFVLVDFYLSPKAKNKLDALILDTINKSYTKEAHRILVIMKESWFYSAFPAIVVSVIYIFRIMACYRTQIKGLFKGERKKMPLKRPPAVLAASIRYTGYQISYLLWGYLILRILYFLISLIIAFVFVIPIQDGNGTTLLNGLGYALLGTALLTTVIIVQVLASQFLFLQNKLYPTDRNKPLAINNRRAFQNFSYFFLFYSVMLGFGTCILRWIMNVFLSCCLFGRIDRPLFPRGYESIDMGYCTWVGMLRVDFYHTHPVALVFCHLLMEERERRKPQSPPALSDVLEVDKQKKFRIKWWLFYTLQNNPKLIMDRKQRSSPSGTFPMGKEELECLKISTVQSRKLEIKESILPEQTDLGLS